MADNLFTSNFSMMKTFITKLCVFIFLFFAIDFCVGVLLNKIYYKVNSGTISKANYGFKFCKEDILIFGASEVAHHFISNEIADSLHLSCYNLGMDGYTITYQYPLLQTIVSRYSPKVIMISTSQLSGKMIEPSLMYPYYNSSSSVREVLDKADVYNKYKLKLNSYIFNSLLLGIIDGILAKAPATNGYIALYGKAKFLSLNTNPSEIKATTESINYFASFLKLAKSTGALVYVFSSPKYQINHKKSDSVLVKSICDRNGVKYINYLTDTSFIKHPELFKDGVHLNNDGAEIFTKKIIDLIKKDYYNQKEN